MTSEDAEPQTRAPDRAPKVNKISAQDIWDSLKAGAADFAAHPVMSGFFGLVYAVFGLGFVWCLIQLGMVWMIIPAIVGFPLVAPFAAAGLYEMSRRRQIGLPIRWRDILTVMADQRKRELGWMAFVTLFVFWVWVYQVRLWLAILLKDASFSDFDGFMQTVLYTPEGWTFLAIGTCVGAFLALALFSVTVIAMPMLLEREMNFVSAMLTSVRAVTEKPLVMMVWAAIVTGALLLSMVPAFVGLIFTLPILGHATWHLYKRAIPEVGAS
ncbi:DUF2189 domain-containing protein [Shimia haliotis]|uniref:Uncharacterized membrane protein n=1 Tax=Shimia haliotis TaxID=1280847 RepID=A0A1I4AQY7_9RHOB|nr:DUF2189 domain-containing protein [Shimia haliotis]SFK58915.1 Uncharacterized membrane protein [Shimia haliotis]